MSKKTQKSIYYHRELNLIIYSMEIILSRIPNITIFDDDGVPVTPLGKVGIS